MPSMNPKVGRRVVILVHVERVHVANGVVRPEFPLLVQLEASHKGRVMGEDNCDTASGEDIDVTYRRGVKVNGRL